MKTQEEFGAELGKIIDKYSLRLPDCTREGKRLAHNEVEIPIVGGAMVVFGKPDQVAWELRKSLYEKIGEGICVEGLAAVAVAINSMRVTAARLTEIIVVCERSRKP